MSVKTEYDLVGDGGVVGREEFILARLPDGYELLATVNVQYPQTGDHSVAVRNVVSTAPWGVVRSRFEDAGGTGPITVERSGPRTLHVQRDGDTFDLQVDARPALPSYFASRLPGIVPLGDGEHFEFDVVDESQGVVAFTARLAVVGPETIIALDRKWDATLVEQRVDGSAVVRSWVADDLVLVSDYGGVRAELVACSEDIGS